MTQARDWLPNHVLEAINEIEAAHVETLTAKTGHLEAGTVVCLSCGWPKHGDHAISCEWSAVMDWLEPDDDA